MKIQSPLFIELPSLQPTLGVVVVLSFALITGCASQRPLMPTPSLYQKEPGASALFGATSLQRQTTGVELLYITDRAPETNPESNQPYGEGRSKALTFGTTAVDMVPDLTWVDLEHQSRLPDRSKDVYLELGMVNEAGRFPQEPYDMEVTDTGLMRSPAVLDQHRSAKAGFQDLLREQLRQSPGKEVVLYIHGFNETFSTAAYTMGELCHFFGREHVCAIFTWPASASGNFLTSYTTTTEAASYAIGHLVKTIRMIAQTPGVEGLHLLAHSRGSAVLLSALRELMIETIAAGVEPLTALKIHNIVMMAPDIDMDVADQQLQIFDSDPDMITRWSGNRSPRIIKGRWTIYASPEDRALSVSRWLFRSRSRVGQISLAELKADDSSGTYAKYGKMDVIVYQGKRTDMFGHAYFATNPEVSSDLIQLIRYGKKPGDPGRPLEKVGPLGWTFPDNDV